MIACTVTSSLLHFVINWHCCTSCWLSHKKMVKKSILTWWWKCQTSSNSITKNCGVFQLPMYTMLLWNYNCLNRRRWDSTWRVAFAREQYLFSHAPSVIRKTDNRDPSRWRWFPVKVTQGGTRTHDLGNGLPCPNQLSYRVTWQLSGWVWLLKAELPGIHPKWIPSWHVRWGGCGEREVQGTGSDSRHAPDLTVKL